MSTFLFVICQVLPADIKPILAQKENYGYTYVAELFLKLKELQ